VVLLSPVPFHLASRLGVNNLKIASLYRIISGFLSASKWNTNATRIETAFANTISRDGSAPNDMEANLDLGDNRIINVGAPVNLNDAVRLQDVLDVTAGDFVVAADWTDIVDKPATFPPEAHTQAASTITDFTEAVQDVVGAAVVGGTNITATYNDITGQVTIDATGALAGDWNTLANKPSTFTPSAHTQAFSTLTDGQEAVEDLIGSSIIAGTDITVSYNDGTGKTTINSTGGGGGTTNWVNFVDEFGGNPDGVTSNDAAFTASEASSYNTIFLPQGNYWTTKLNSFFNKNYIGEGKILISSGTSVLPGKRNLATTPSFGGISSEYGESGDTKLPEMMYEYVRAGTRENLNNHYFQAGANGKFTRFFSLSGSSGTNAHLVAAANATATTADLNSATGLIVGDTIGFMLNDGATATDTVVISNIAVGGGVGGSDRITFSPALANTYPYAGSDYAVPTYISGYATNSRVSKGYRTNNAHQFFTVDAGANSGGDVYGIVGRIANSYVVKPGQTDFFEGCTVAFIGGDMAFTGDGQYGTPWEFNTTDQGFDVAVINVHSYGRTNDTGARRVTWIHDFAKSEGSKPIDVFYSMHGKGRVGIDMTLADFSSDGERAIQMKTGQRIYFDASANAAPGTRARGFWGNVQGDTYITAMNDGSDGLDLWVGGVRAFRGRSTSINSSLQFNLANNLVATGHIATARTKAIYLDGLGSNTYISFDGSSIYMFKNGSLVQTW